MITIIPSRTRRDVFTFALMVGLAIYALILGGCVNAIEMSRSTPAQLAIRVAHGRPPALHAGSNFSYWLWRDSDGVWHLRTTTARHSRRFQGRVRALDGGSIKDLTSVSLDGGRRSADAIGMVAGDVAFDFITAGGIDGFDFRIEGASRLEFDLRINRNGDPGRIIIGQRQIKPSNSHFILFP
jgi:hypothetical protein